MIVGFKSLKLKTDFLSLYIISLIEIILDSYINGINKKMLKKVILNSCY